MSDSANKTEDTEQRPEGLCRTCVNDCFSDWYIELCSEYREVGK